MPEMNSTSGDANTPQRPATIGLAMMQNEPVRLDLVGERPVDLTPSIATNFPVAPPPDRATSSQQQQERGQAKNQSASKSNKTYTCKLCNDKTKNKQDHWTHMRTHFDPNKLFACKLCPFVTKYRHHLEYHRRNHDGVKPFKCATCKYECVNLSMLKSHMRSHTHECPFKCHICVYSSKYAHSLRQHLKKYHQDSRNDQIMLDVFVNNNENSNTELESCGTTTGGSELGSPTSPTSSTSSTSAFHGSMPELPQNTLNNSSPGLLNVLDLRVGSKALN